MTKASEGRTVKLDVASRFEMLDVVQTVLVQVCQLVGFDEEAKHYMSVAVRESVVNAIKHGNRQDEKKRVFVASRSAGARSRWRCATRARASTRRPCPIRSRRRTC